MVQFIPSPLRGSRPPDYRTPVSLGSEVDGYRGARRNKRTPRGGGELLLCLFDAQFHEGLYEAEQFRLSGRHGNGVCACARRRGWSGRLRSSAVGQPQQRGGSDCTDADGTRSSGHAA